LNRPWAESGPRRGSTSLAQQPNWPESAHAVGARRAHVGRIHRAHGRRGGLPVGDGGRGGRGEQEGSQGNAPGKISDDVAH
jgi:hypothetical protein